MMFRNYFKPPLRTNLCVGSRGPILEIGRLWMPVPLFNGMVVPLDPLPLEVRDLRLALNLIVEDPGL